jgi:anti-anti-sigma factor
MKLLVTEEQNRAHFTIEGDIDEKSAEILKQRFNKLNHSMMREIVFDFKSVQHIGSSGIGKMLLFYKKLAVSGGIIRIVKASETVYDLLLALKLDSVFEISKS